MPSLKNIAEKVEKVSVAYAEQNGLTRTHDWYVFKLQEEVGELTKAYMKVQGKTRKNEVTQEQLAHEMSLELADVFCHVLLFARHNNIDIEKAIEEKWFKYL